MWENLCAAIIIFLFYRETFFLPLFMDVGILLNYINYL